MTTPTIMIKSTIMTVTTTMAMVDVSEVGAVEGKEVDAVLNHVQTITNISLSKSGVIGIHLMLRTAGMWGKVFKTHLVQPPSLKTLPCHSLLYSCRFLQCFFDPPMGQW